MEHWFFHSSFFLVWIFSNFSRKKIWQNLAGGGLQIADISLNDMHFLQFAFLARTKIERAVNLRRRKNFICIISKSAEECQKFLSQSRAPSRAKKTATESKCAALGHSSDPMTPTLPGSDSMPLN